MTWQLAWAVPIGNLLIPQLAGPSILAFAQGPTSAPVGTSIAPSITVDVEDALGNVVTSDNSDVTLSIGNNPSGGSLQGTLTVAAVNGVATFSGLDIDTLGNGYTLIASDGGLSSATSAAFNITAAPPAVSGIIPASGPTTGGTSVTITGTNLANATAVDFGSTAATITSDSATQIVATSPVEPAGTVDVTVVAAGGTSARRRRTSSPTCRPTVVAPVAASPVP